MNSPRAKPLSSLSLCVLAIAASVWGPSCQQVSRNRDEEIFVEPVQFSPPQEDSDPKAIAQAELRKQTALSHGRTVYRQACATCHGLAGDGKGRSSRPLDPKPRDFTGGTYKWRSTISGSLPLDQDIFRTITRGVPGTTMPAWGHLLSDGTRWDLVEYVKSFSPRFREEGVEEDEVVSIPQPVLTTQRSIDRGREVFAEKKCFECHGTSGRGDGPSASTLKDSWGHPIKPFDFTLGGYRCGSSEQAIYRTFFTGLNGTPMPSFGDSISEEDRWSLVHYVRSLQRELTLFEQLFCETP